MASDWLKADNLAIFFSCLCGGVLLWTAFSVVAEDQYNNLVFVDFVWNSVFMNVYILS